MIYNHHSSPTSFLIHAMTNDDGFSSRQLDQLHNLFLEGRTATRKMIENSEHRTKSALKDYIDHRFTAHTNQLQKEVREMKNEILDGVADLMDNVVSPRFDSHERRLTRLEKASNFT